MKYRLKSDHDVTCELFGRDLTGWMMTHPPNGDKKSMPKWLLDQFWEPMPDEPAKVSSPFVENDLEWVLSHGVTIKWESSLSGKEPLELIKTACNELRRMRAELSRQQSAKGYECHQAPAGTLIEEILDRMADREAKIAVAGPTEIPAFVFMREAATEIRRLKAEHNTERPVVYRDKT